MGFLTDAVTANEDLLEYIGLEIYGIAFKPNEASVLVDALRISYCAKYVQTEACRGETFRRIEETRKTPGKV
ncbi:hypothetical protein HD806DRAFT_514832, partial [Xylariaceae sp. AK1471]